MEAWETSRISPNTNKACWNECDKTIYGELGSGSADMTERSEISRRSSASWKRRNEKLPKKSNGRTPDMLLAMDQLAVFACNWGGTLLPLLLRRCTVLPLLIAETCRDLQSTVP
jgi:hypothetical protein